MVEFSKSERKELRRLADAAYERELGNHLEVLFQVFERWKKKTISPFDLSDLIHEFHQGPSRELYRTYHSLGPEVLVPRAVAFDLLKVEEIPANLLGQITEQIKAFMSDS